MTLFFTGDGESADTIIVALELPNNDWFKRALVEALTLMCDQNNWGDRGTATEEFARDKACEMNETMEFDVLIPTLPIGAVTAWAVATVPAKWLKCDGASVLRATYPALFEILGTVYGEMDGTHFSLPDYREYSLMGAGTTVAIAGAAGSFLHPISTDEMPIHSHGVNDPGHAHTVKRYNATNAGTVNMSQWQTALNPPAAVSPSTDSAVTGITTQNAGGSEPMSVLHPVRGVNYIIYAGV